MNAIAKGNKFSQQNVANWSNLNLGNVALNHTKIKQNKQVLIPNTIDCTFKIVLWTKISGKLYPPKNKMALILLNNTIELYSAKKKNTKGTLECSVKKPATSSDSASWRSKGVRDVSANIDIKYIKNIGNNGIINQIACWCSIIEIKFREPDKITTIKIAELNTNS